MIEFRLPCPRCSALSFTPHTSKCSVNVEAEAEATERNRDVQNVLYLKATVPTIFPSEIFYLLYLGVYVRTGVSIHPTTGRSMVPPWIANADGYRTNFQRMVHLARRGFDRCQLAADGTITIRCSKCAVHISHDTPDGCGVAMHAVDCANRPSIQV